MRRASALVVVGMLAVAALAAGSADAQVTPVPGIGPAAPAAGSAVIRGSVVAADTGSPVRRAQVRAVSTDNQDNRVAVTDDQGRFELRELAGGRYTLMASRAGFVTLQYGQRRPNERGTPVEVAAGGVLDRIAFSLPRGGVITGHITDDAGEPLAETQVQVLRSMFAPGGRRMLPVGRGDTTDDQGAFRIYGLMPGEYVVSAVLRAPMPMAMANGRPAASVDQGYAPTYYPGTPSLGDAQRVTVGVGQEVSGVSFGLIPTRVARISGRVVGGPPGQAEGFVMVMPEDGAMVGPASGGGMVQPDGTFELAAVPPGRYTLRVQPRGRREAEDLVGMTTVTVAGVDLAGVVIPLQRPGTISGRIEFEGGPPAGLTAGQVRVMPMPSDPVNGRLMMTGPPRTADDFTFTIGGTSAPVFLRVTAPGWHLKAIEHSGQDVTDSPIPLAPGTVVEGVRVVLTQASTTFSGVVRDDRGAPVVEAAVVVFPDDDTRWSFASRFVRSARPDQQGRFEFTGLPPYANYRVVALPALEDGQIFDPEFLSSLSARADRFGLAAGESKSQDLRLRP